MIRPSRIREDKLIIDFIATEYMELCRGTHVVDSLILTYIGQICLLLTYSWDSIIVHCSALDISD